MDQGNQGKLASTPAITGYTLSLNAGTMVKLITILSPELAGKPLWNKVVELNKTQVPAGPSMIVEEPSGSLTSEVPVSLPGGLR